jgi:YidC/Oxa1 family membrane protein insertase
MGKLKPHMARINEKYKDDPQRKQQETMKLYREHNVNPLGMMKGCVWMMVQMPVFIGLYTLLGQVIDLRGAEFLWIEDLSHPDRLVVLSQSLPLIGHDFNLLPLITALTQMLSSKFTMSANTATDAQQQQMQKMMIYFMPVFILFITYGFPAGLMLYWLVSNLWQVLQQLWVNKHIKRPAEEAAAAAG